MVNRTNVIKMLNLLGFEANEVSKTAGNTTLHGIAIEPEGGGPAWPVLYVDDMPDDEHEVISMLLTIRKEAHPPTSNLDRITNDPEWLMDHVMIGLRYRPDETDDVYVASHPFNTVDIEKYYYVDFGEGYTAKLTKSIVNGYMENDDDFMAMLRIAAEENTFSKTVIKNLGGMYGAEDDMAWVVTNDDHLLGASAILNPRVVSFCKAKKIKRVAMIPSSIHEVIILDKEKGNLTYDDIVGMLRGGNEMNEPRDILANEPIIFEMDYVGDSFGR